MKFTLFDLLSFICGTTPIGMGFIEGKKAGIIGITIGLILGSMIGVGAFLLVRLPIDRFLTGYCKNRNPDNIWNVITVSLIYLGLIVIALLAVSVSEFTVNVVVSSLLKYI